MTQTIVLLSIDSLRADHCSVLGYDRETTPELRDALSDGTLYERCFAQSSHTRESMPSMLYGVYPPRLSAVGHAPDGSQSLASLLAEGGWATAAFHSNPYLSRAYGFDDGFDTFEDGLPLATNRVVTFLHRVRNHFSTEPYTRAETLNHQALAWLADRGGQPTFVWIHYMDPHGPYHPPAAYQREFRDEVLDDRRAKRLWRRSVDDPESLSDTDVETLVDLYDAEIRYTDAMVGELLAGLDDLDAVSDPTVVIASDHGELFGEHGQFGHPRRVHRELVHVPLALLDSDGGGDTVAHPVENVDIVPTVLDLAGLDATEFDGRSLRSPTGDPGAFSFASGEGDEEDRFWAALRSRERTVRGVWTWDGGCVESTVETSDGNAITEETGNLRERLHAVLDSTGATDGTVERDAEETVDSVVTDRLEELGYR